MKSVYEYRAFGGEVHLVRIANEDDKRRVVGANETKSAKRIAYWLREAHQRGMEEQARKMRRALGINP